MKAIQIILTIMFCAVFGFALQSFVMAEVVNKTETNQADDDKLSDTEKAKLLEIARKTLVSLFEKDGKGAPGEADINFSDKFRVKRGAFVTLKIGGNLRGCIGYIFPREPLVRTIINNTTNSALHDRRFRPVQKSEIKDIDIEISALSQIKEIAGYEEFENGKHGIIIRKGMASAVFLPQVAVEQNWKREETLSHLCAKAGLKQDEWKREGMKFSVFTAEVFGEKEHSAE